MQSTNDHILYSNENPELKYGQKSYPSDRLSSLNKSQYDPGIVSYKNDKMSADLLDYL